MRRSPLVGREAERAAIEAALARCRAGAGGLVLVSGEAGVGKSRLVEESLIGWPSQWLRGSAVSGCSGYAPLLDIQGVGPWVPEVHAPEGELEKAALGDFLRRAFLHAAGPGPVVIVLEDLHWADAATLELLPTLAAAWEREPLLILGTFRSDQLPRAHPLRRTRTELRRGGRLAEVELRPLAREETGELLVGVLGVPVNARLLDAIHDRAGGLPFFVGELAASVAENLSLRERSGFPEAAADADLPLPDSVVDAVLARTADLCRTHGRAVELAAVLGVRVHLPVLAELVPPDDVDHLLDAGLLIELDRPATGGADVAVFRHALVQEALHSAIPWGRRRRHHVSVARCLTEQGAPPEIVAEHWIAAHEYDRARPLLLEAAERNCSLHAYRDAARLARRALDVWPDQVDVPGRIIALERLAVCAELCDEQQAAAEVWAAVVTLYRTTENPSGVGPANRRLANAQELLGERTGAIAAREAAAEAFAAAGAHGEAAEERLVLAEHLWSAANTTRALEHAVAATEEAEVADRPDLQARALAIQGGILATIGQGARGVELARAGLALALERQLAEPAGEAYYQLATALLYATDYAASADAYESAFALCRKHDIHDMAQACSACLSVVARLMGDWDRSLSISADVLDSDGMPQQVRMVAQEELGLISALRGNRRQARGALRRAAAFGRAHEVFGIEVGARWGLIVVADLDGDDAAADRDVSALLERCEGKEEWHFALPALRWVSTFLAEQDDVERGARCHRLLARPRPGTARRRCSQRWLMPVASLCWPAVMPGGRRFSSGARLSCFRASPRRTRRHCRS